MLKSKDLSFAALVTGVRLKKIVSNGFFPSELPPVFTTTGLGMHATELLAGWDVKAIQKSNMWSRPEAYSIPRYGEARRMLAIVNPINQLRVSGLIADNWADIQLRLARSKATEFKPTINIGVSNRAVSGVDFDGVARRRAEILSKFGRYVKTDIARFYPSIYTHAIAWSIVGKDYAKKHHNTKAFQTSYANDLDKAVGAGQEGQTIGIPIGPDTSRIIAELIATEFEVGLSNSMPDFGARAVRYVDDMFIGIHSHETPSTVLSPLAGALHEIELELNAEKTETIGIGSPHSREWLHYIRTFQLSSRASVQRADLDSFFDQVFFLADANPRENVLLYAVKRAASFNLNASNVAHLNRLLMYSARRAPSCLRFVAEFLAASQADNGLTEEEVSNYIKEQIPLKATAAHTEELSWLLFWAREIGITLPAATLEKVTHVRSSIVALLVLELVHLGLVDGSIDVSMWESYADNDGLKSEMWLVAYEATKKGWWPTAKSPDYITSHPFFKDLYSRNVEFYDASKKAQKKPKGAVHPPSPSHDILGYGV